MAAIASLYRKCTLMILHLPSAVWLQVFAWSYCSFCCLKLLPFAVVCCFNNDKLAKPSIRLAMVLEKGGALEVEVPTFGHVCGFKERLLYRKTTREEALFKGAWHLFGKNAHSEEYTWQESVYASEASLTKDTQCIYIVIDEEGQEVGPPTRICWSCKGNGKGKSRAADYYWDGRRKSRSRRRRQH